MKRQRINIDEMSMKELFQLRTDIRKKMQERIQIEIPKMLRSLPPCITEVFGKTDLWNSDDKDLEWAKEQDLKVRPTGFDLLLFLSLGDLWVTTNFCTDLSDNIWRIEIEGNTQDGIGNWQWKGDRIEIKFKYLSGHSYYDILKLVRFSDSPWFLYKGIELYDRRIPEVTDKAKELYSKLLPFFTEEVLNFWKSNFDRILYE